MRLTIQHILELLDSLEKGAVYDYVHSKTSKVALLNVDFEEKSASVKKITKKDPTGKEAKFTTRMFEILENGVVENKPFSIDVVFNNSGSNRSALEALLARTSEFYACMVGTNKHLIWVPSKPHEIGSANTWEGTQTPPSVEALKEGFRVYLLDPKCFDTPGTGQRYWSTITSDKPEIQFLKEIILDVTAGRTDDIFSVYKKEEATQIWKKTIPDKRNRDFNRSIVSAILGKYKDFLGTFSANRGLFPPPETDAPLQVIYYGAPGTGKSRRVKNYFLEHAVPDSKVFRTTFHPDTDYASFVGSYKPIVKYSNNENKECEVCDVPPTQRITYEFAPQVFTKAYVEAWKNTEEDVFLVIEEINRGNCAQIFGDLFQLLDRLDNGRSEFPIIADNDLAQFLMSDDQLGKNNEGIKDGKLKLPGNLHIWATMNTSDQSLFPMDSAFKRRWEQEYVRIDYADASKSFVLDIAGERFDWGIVLRRLNDYIKESVHSTNKLLGNRFVNPKNGSVIEYKLFRDKVLFYLFNDVFKDDDSFAADFFDEKEGYLFFEDLCENDDPRFSSSFIHNTLKVNSLDETVTDTPNGEQADEENEV